MKTLKLIGKLMAIVLLTTAGFCDDDEVEYTCEDCIAAQAELCNALGASNCSNDAGVGRASDKVRERCDNGGEKVASSQNACFYNENATCSSFSCH